MREGRIVSCLALEPVGRTSASRGACFRYHASDIGTFHERAKVVDSLPGYTSGMAGCRDNLAPRAKLSRRLRFSTDGTMRPL